MKKEEENVRVPIPVYDLLDACCALHGGLELDKFEDKIIP